MSWLRYDDRFTEDCRWDTVSHAARWHYIAMVEECSRARTWDGRLPARRARRVSDVEDPDACLKELDDAGFVLNGITVVTLLEIAEHVPPASIRTNAEKTRVRMRRLRAHRAGDHSLCLPDHCPEAVLPIT